MAVIPAPLGNISRVTFQIFTTLGIIFLLEAEMEYFTFYDLVKYKRFWRNFFPYLPFHPPKYVLV